MTQKTKRRKETSIKIIKKDNKKETKKHTNMDNKDNKSIKNEAYLNKILNQRITRKEFIKKSILTAVGITVLASSWRGLFFNKLTNSLKYNISNKDFFIKNKDFLKEAMFYEKYDFGVKCKLCPHECFLQEGARGICRVRENHNNILYTLVYNRSVAIHIDPIEKKPLFHFYPGTTAFSLATAGCNLRCLNCQNWEISQSKPEDLRSYKLTPQEIVEEAIQKNTKSIAYTYSEPIIFYEYMLDTAKLAKEKGIKNIMITAGYINEKPLRYLCRYIDATNIDLKSFSDSIYRKLNGGTLKPVLNALKVFKEENVWIEITNLVIPNWTDNLNMIRKMSNWLYKNGFENTPLHFSRFYPQYKLRNLPPTPIKTLERARKIAMEEGLKFVYIGNVPGHEGENTYCPKCGKLLIKREGYNIIENHIVNGKCEYCKTEIPGFWL